MTKILLALYRPPIFTVHLLLQHLFMKVKIEVFVKKVLLFVNG